MNVFIDTSAFIALLNREDENHSHAARTWNHLIENDDTLVTSNYVMVETLALLQRRLDMTVVRAFIDDVLPIITVEWIDEELHAAAISALLTAGKNGPGIVDGANFALMRKFSLRHAFTFDRHFKAQGFTLMP